MHSSSSFLFLIRRISSVGMIEIFFPLLSLVVLLLKPEDARSLLSFALGIGLEGMFTGGEISLTFPSLVMHVASSFSMNEVK